MYMHVQSPPHARVQLVERSVGLGGGGGGCTYGVRRHAVQAQKVLFFFLSFFFFFFFLFLFVFFSAAAAALLGASTVCMYSSGNTGRNRCRRDTPCVSPRMHRSGDIDIYALLRRPAGGPYMLPWRGTRRTGTVRFLQRGPGSPIGGVIAVRRPPNRRSRGRVVAASRWGRRSSIRLGYIAAAVSHWRSFPVSRTRGMPASAPPGLVRFRFAATSAAAKSRVEAAVRCGGRLQRAPHPGDVRPRADSRARSGRGMDRTMARPDGSGSKQRGARRSREPRRTALAVEMRSLSRSLSLSLSLHARMQSLRRDERGLFSASG